MVQNASDVVAILEADGTLRYLSPSVERMLGYRPEELVGTLAFDLVHPEDIEFVSRSFAEALQHPGILPPIEFRARSADGCWRYMEAIRNNLLDDPDIRGIVINARDVTERKEAEKALEESERRFSSVVSDAHAYAYRCLNEPGYPNEFASDYAQELTGYPPEDLLVGGQTRFGDLIVEEDQGRVWEEVQKALAERRSFELRYAIRCRDGAIRHVQEYGRGIYDEGGDVVALEGLVYDITELVETEQRLREAEERYRTLVEQIPAIVYVEAMDGRMSTLYDSPQIETILGYPRDTYQRDPHYWARFIHPDDKERVLAAERDAMAGARPFNLEYRVMTSDGRMVWLRDEPVVIRDEEGRPLYWQGVISAMTKA